MPTGRAARSDRRRQGRTHYGLWILLLATLTVTVTLGHGRFGLGFVVPGIKADLQLSGAQVGLMATLNFLGYTLATAVSGLAVARFGYRRLLPLACLAVALGLLATTLATGYVLVVCITAFVGFSTGMGYVPASALLAGWFGPRRRGVANGILIGGGAGLSILMAGVIFPLFYEAQGPAGWRFGWAVLAATSLVMALVGARYLRQRPEDLGLQPIGGGSAAAGGAAPEPAGGAPAAGRPIWHSSEIWHLGLVYLVFGVAYVPFGTFLVDFLIDDRGFSPGAAGQIWSFVGLLSFVGAMLWGVVSDVVGRRAALVGNYLLAGGSYLLLALHPAATAIWVAAMVHATCYFAPPALMGALTGDWAGPGRAAAAFGFVTLFFAAGQSLSPLLAGISYDLTGTYAQVFWLAGAVFLAGSLAALALPQRPRL